MIRYNSCARIHAASTHLYCLTHLLQNDPRPHAPGERGCIIRPSPTMATPMRKNFSSDEFAANSDAASTGPPPGGWRCPAFWMSQGAKRKRLQ